MTQIKDPAAELRDLAERSRTGVLTAAEKARLEELRSSAQPGPASALWEAGPVVEETAEIEVEVDPEDIEEPPPPEATPTTFLSAFVPGEHRVVLHLMEGQVLRGTLADADLGDPELGLLQPDGSVSRIPAEQLKAVFFMLPLGERPAPASGTRVRVTFGDGRELSGLSPDYAPDAQGFFVLPLDARTHTARVWVYRAAVRQVTVEPPTG